MKELVSSPERKQVMEEPTYDHFWKFHNKDNMDVHAVALIEQQAERIKELELAKTIGIQACDLLKERIKELGDYLIEFGQHEKGCLANISGTGEHCNCGFEQALKG